MPVTASSPPARSIPAWALTWAGIVVATLGAVVTLAWLSSTGARNALEAALEDHVAVQAGLADGALRDLPVEVLVALEGEHSSVGLNDMVDELRQASDLYGLALFGPDGQRFGGEADGLWVPEQAERDLIDQARAGSPVTGPLYRDRAGDLFLTAYRPFTGHPGWVVGVEGSAATLRAVTALERDQKWVGAGVTLVAVLLGGLLALLIGYPLRRLQDALGGISPGDPPEALPDFGPREVRGVSAAARGLLTAIRERDADLNAAHRHEVEQLERLAAEVAHEVRNPLNAMTLSIDRLGRIESAAERERVVTRVRDQIGELEAIVQRLLDLTRPLEPQPIAVDLAHLVQALGTETSLNVTVTGSATLQTDPLMLSEILRNLLLNAEQAGARSVTVDIDQSPDAITLVVTDDGPGIAESDHIFEWFHTTRASGSGLGLPLSRRIAEALGGTIDLTCPSPARFTLRLKDPR